LPSDTVRDPILPETGEINNQIDFVRAWYRWPRGLLFYGPSSKIRTDDPSERFEEESVHIIGQHYFDKVKELHVELGKFNDDYETQRSTEQGKETMTPEAQRLYIRLGTIYTEYNNGEPIVVFPFNTHQWVLQDGKWKINTEFPTTGIVYDAVSNEWIEKTIAQEADREEQISFDIGRNMAVLGVLSTMQKYQYDHDELRRRKRHHVHRPIVYVEGLYDTCARHSVKRDQIDKCNYYLGNGSPSILAVPAWGWCKVFG